MRTWKISNGDIALDTLGRVEELGGSMKIVQDLRSLLLNDSGFNRFFPELGTDLDRFVGQNVDYRLLSDIRASVADVLNDYMDKQQEEIRKRIEERGEPYIAIGLAEPSSLVKEWSPIQVREEAGNISIKIGFKTYTNDYEEVLLSIAGGTNYRV